METPRQTLSYLHQLLRERGIKPKNKLGQNFLIDLNLIDLLLRSAELTPDDLAIEVGTGTGSLTAQLADQAGAVLSVEIDPAFHAMADEAIGPRDNVLLLYADVLKGKNEIHPRVLAALGEVRAKARRPVMKMVANLPYAVATPVITNFLMSELPFERFVVTVQWEIAERLVAEPGQKAYGALAVLVQSLADVEIIRRLAPTVFWPRPKVDSAFVRIWPRAAKRAEVVKRVGSVQNFRDFLRDLYTHRRKNLRGAIVGWPSGRREKADVDAKLAALNFDSAVRAEALDREQHLRLCEAFQ